jgi:FkbM family methyltransferase
VSALHKRLVRRVLRSSGLAIRDIGRGVGGVELLHDARILLGPRDHPVLFDVGANLGQSTLAMLEYFPAPTIHAFEPSPSTFRRLQRAVGHRANVTLVPAALGDQQGRLPFHVTSEYSANDSLLSPAWTEGVTVVEVQVDTVDQYCARHGIERIDLLKIDAQGYDLHVLRGAAAMLRDRRVTLFTCEFNHAHLYAGQPSLRELLAFADDAGYELVGFYEQTYVANALSYFDMLFQAGSGRVTAR